MIERDILNQKRYGVKMREMVKELENLYLEFVFVDFCVCEIGVYIGIFFCFLEMFSVG